MPKCEPIHTRFHDLAVDEMKFALPPETPMSPFWQPSAITRDIVESRFHDPVGCQPALTYLTH